MRIYVPCQNSKNGRIPVIIANDATQAVMHPGSKPNPFDSIGVVFTNGAHAKLLISRYVDGIDENRERH